MADIAGLALACVALVNSCLSVSKFVVTAKDFPLEAKALRIGFIVEAARLKTWARTWSISTENDLNFDLTANTNSTNVLRHEAEDASLDLVVLQEILSNMWELISEGKAIRSSHESVLSDTVRNSCCSAHSWREAHAQIGNDWSKACLQNQMVFRLREIPMGCYKERSLKDGCVISQGAQRHA
jgi:hypothetical protein